ncbi:GRXC9 [Linum perenne]
MQETAPTTAAAGEGSSRSNGDDVRKLVSENSIIVFGKRGCCMCHVVKRLLNGLGVNPTVYDVDEPDEGHVAKELSSDVQFPVVFVGGKVFGGLERVMATHISGELVPILKDAGALWL